VLYRLDPDGALQEMGTGFTVSNGMGWSPNGRTMYFTDTRRRVILAFNFDLETGRIDNRRVFVEVPADSGFPDGLTVDGEGFVWSAEWGGWCVTRYAPTGEIERKVRLPVSNVTNCAFGGRNLDELYITSARVTLSDEDLVAQPLAGALFCLKTNVRGQKERRFKG
jgi:sugar lactone lactonase YvrE